MSVHFQRTIRTIYESLLNLSPVRCHDEALPSLHAKANQHYAVSCLQGQLVKPPPQRGFTRWRCPSVYLFVPLHVVWNAYWSGTGLSGAAYQRRPVGPHCYNWQMPNQILSFRKTDGTLSILFNKGIDLNTKKIIKTCVFDKNASY